MKFRPEIDNGCQITCIHPWIVTKLRLKQLPLPQPIPMVNADGSKNCQHDATHIAHFCLKLRQHLEVMEALVLDIGKNKMLLGQDWLAAHNLSINWSNR